MSSAAGAGSRGRRMSKGAAALAVAALAVAGLLVAGCTAGGKSDGPPDPDSRRASTAQDSGPSQAARVAEDVQRTLTPQLNGHEQEYGAGTNSPCSTSRSSMFTSACQDAADAVNDDATEALAAVSGQPGFATLRSVAARLQKAVGQYTGLGCAHAPGDASVRHQCLAPAAQIAQGESDLRDGVNLGLSGQ